MTKGRFVCGVLAAFGTASAQAADPISLGVQGTVVENFGFASNGKMNEAAAPSSIKADKLAEQDDATIGILGKAEFDDDISLALQTDVYGTASDLSRSANGTCGPIAGAAAPSKCSANVFVKRAFATFGSPAGSLILGRREDTTYVLHIGAPDVSPLARSGGGYFYYWVIAPSAHRTFTQDNDARYDDRSAKVSYVSPAFHGLTGAFTYVPSLSSSAGPGSPAPATSSDYGLVLPGGPVSGAGYGGDAYAGGMYYSDSLQGIAVKADATVLRANVANLRIWHQGLQLSYAGFTFGCSSLLRDVPGNATIDGIDTNATAARLAGLGTTAAAIAQTAVFAGNAYTVGLRYALGPYSVSAAFFHDNSKSLAALNGSGGADTTNFYDLGAAYDLGVPVDGGPRVTLRTGIAYVSYKGPVANASAPWVNNNDGISAVTGVKLDF